MKIGKPIGKNSINDLERIKSLLQDLSKILRENKGGNFVSGIKNTLIILNEDDQPLNIRMDTAGTIYKDMLGGMGTLGDFIINHPDKETAEKLNKELAAIEEELWELFGLNLSHLPSVEKGYPPGHPYWNIKDPSGEDS